MANIGPSLELYKLIPWYFEKEHYNIQPNEYLLQINKKSDSAFLVYVCPCHFDIKILEKYKNFLIWTYPTINSENRQAYCSLFAIDPNTILEITPMRHNFTKYVVAIRVHTNKPKFFFSFIEENSSFEYEEKPRNVGFSGIVK